jgi:DNA (cytosine-5)-methyltransferase 1
MTGQVAGPQAIELCAGLGGIGIALRNLGYHVARAYDSWESAIRVYNHNVGGDIAAKCNLLSSAGRDLVREAKQSLGEIELVAAGPPCKGFSQLRNGYHDGRNGHNRVLAAIPEYIGVLRPRVFLIENVPDLVRHRNGRTLAGLLAKLQNPTEGLRYTVSHRTYDAARFGTPQARRRVLILGLRQGERGSLPVPAPDLSPLYAALRHTGLVPTEFKADLAVLRDPDDLALTTARQALSDLPLLQPGAQDDEAEYAGPPQTAFQRWVRRGASARVRNVRTPRVTPAVVARLEHIPPGGCARTIPDEHLDGLARRYDSAYRRLHPDAPSTALSTKYDCVYHYAMARSLSVREYARLQGIPDRISFPADAACRRDAYEMIGNSVPPPLIAGVLSAALEISPADQDE